MSLSDYISITAIFGGISTVLGWWLRTRLDASVKHEYSRLLESFKAELRRAEVLGSERLEAFKVISEQLISLRRYCHACSNEYGEASEFDRRPDILPEGENKPLLQHHESICREIEKYELFLSPATRKAFGDLTQQMSLGFNLEIWLQSDNDPKELNAEGLYDSVAVRVNAVLDCLYRDLGLPDEPHEGARDGDET